MEHTWIGPQDATEQAALENVRAICSTLPEVEERLSHSEPAWFIRGKKSFATMDSHHHGAKHYAVWCAAPFGAQDAMVAARPDVYFRPPYVGTRGWVGIRLDVDGLDWDEVAAALTAAYRAVAPAKLAALLDGRIP